VVSKLRVTFDSQVLGKVIFPEKRKKDQDHACLAEIHAALLDGVIEGFICESIATLEAIKSDTRAPYFANRIPKSEARVRTCGNDISVNITIRTDHDRHPGLHEKLGEKLHQAQAFGMRVLQVPALNIQLPKYLLNNAAFYESRLFETQCYADRFWEIAASIEARGVGSAAIKAVIESFRVRLPESVTASRSGMQLLEYAENEAEETRVSKAIAEWADGDLVASHLASANDLLCSEDRGKSASGPSILDDTSRAWLKESYGIQIVSIRELAAQIAACPLGERPF
jgi:hypothetical protein